MRSIKKQMALLTALMVLVVAALTLGGLQLFGKGKVQPSEWFKKADKPQVEQTTPETDDKDDTPVVASVVRGSLLASGDGISAQADTPDNTWVDAVVVVDSLSGTTDNIADGTLKFSIYENNVVVDSVIFTYKQQMYNRRNGMTMFDKTFYRFTATADVSCVISKGYGNFAFQFTDSNFSGRNTGVELNGTTLTLRSGDFDYHDPSYDDMDMVDGYLLTSEGNNTYGISFISGKFKITCGFTAMPLPTSPEKEGYTFAGWYMGNDENCDGKSCVAYTNTFIYEDTELHAHFTINKHTVTFDSNGGTAVANQMVDWGTSLTCSTPARTGYIFRGWFLEDGTKYTDQAIKSDTKLTAKWEIKVYTVTFYVDGKVYETMQVNHGTQLVAAMESANVASYSAATLEGARVSKLNSVITETTSVLVTELSPWEKYGDFVARNQWYTWTLVGVAAVLLILATVGVVYLSKKR